MNVAGKRNRLIVIQKRTGARDELNQPVNEWVKVAETLANIRYINGTEFVTSNREVSKATASMRIGYREDLDATMRVLHRGAIYSIEAVLPDMGSRKYVDLAVSAGVNNG